MVKFYESSFKYDYPFPAVSLAYFLRYPNPYATHVLSTDVIDRTFDPTSQQLTTTRLHLKRSKIPTAIVKLLPKGILGRGADSGESFILEKSVIDLKDGSMRTEARNLEWTGILSVVERQLYRRPANAAAVAASSSMTGPGAERQNFAERTWHENTEVTTTVTLLSRFGQARKQKRKDEGGAMAQHPSADDDESPKKGLFSSWSTSSLQLTIESLGLRRTREALGKSKEGMNVVLERLRTGGLKQVLEGMQQDRQRVPGHDGVWKQAWRHGQDRED